MAAIFLNWAVLAVSIFNAAVMVWMGLTVLLNTARRNWGVWLIGGGMITGAAFFISHTAIVARELTISGAGTQGVEFWWQFGWVPVVLAPYAWYVAMLWYAGYWQAMDSRLRRRHRFGFALVTVQVMGMILLIIFANPFGSYAQITQLDFSGMPAIGNIPLLFGFYPVFILTCLILAIDSLRRPEPSDRVMGELARQRAHPWLMATSALLLGVGVFIAAFLFWFVNNAPYSPYRFMVRVPQGMVLFDLLLSSLIALAQVCLGQAIVTYEVFTDKVLPRRGFFRHWRNALVLCGGLAVVVAWSLIIDLHPIYSLLVAVLIAVVFYALLVWRLFLEREWLMLQLRPFVRNQGMVQALLHPQDSSTARSQASEVFRAMCRDVLGTSEAYLIPLGMMAPLAGATLVYPASQNNTLPPLPIEQFGVEQGVVALDTRRFGRLRWAIPLFAERGLSGALLLGEKHDGGLYSQEEIEIARATGERTIDLLASEQMSRRLLDFQQQHQVQTRLMDMQTRRVLHDEVLPTLHTTVLSLTRLPTLDAEASQRDLREAVAALSQAHRQIGDLIHRPRTLIPPEAANGDLVVFLRRLVEDEFEGIFNAIVWQVETPLPVYDPLVQSVIGDAVREVVRNAAVHGRGTLPQRRLSLTITIARDTRDESGEYTLSIRDDGVGLEQAVRSDSSTGTGNGLALHGTLLAVIGASLAVQPAAGGGTEAILTLPDPTILQTHG